MGNIARAFIGSVAVLSFEVLELSPEFADLQEIYWQCAVELA